MTFSEMVAKVLPIFPNAMFEEGPNGELMLATGLRLKNGDVVPLDEYND